jgi:hypothetical protein
MLFWTSGYKVLTFNGFQKGAVKFAYLILPVRVLANPEITTNYLQ